MFTIVDACVDFIFEKIIKTNEIPALNKKLSDQDSTGFSRPVTIRRAKRQQPNLNRQNNLSVITENSSSSNIIPLRSSKYNEGQTMQTDNSVSYDMKYNIFANEDDKHEHEELNKHKQDTPKFINLKSREPGTLKKMFFNKQKNKNIHSILKNSSASPIHKTEALSVELVFNDSPLPGLEKLVKEASVAQESDKNKIMDSGSRNASKSLPSMKSQNKVTFKSRVSARLNNSNLLKK
jgi:hypothetical protein